MDGVERGRFIVVYRRGRHNHLERGRYTAGAGRLTVFAELTSVVVEVVAPLE